MKKCKIVEMQADQELSLRRMKKRLREQHACYVLITCQEPSSDGEMQVEMSYEGDEALAAYLVESASAAFAASLEDKTTTH